MPPPVPIAAQQTCDRDPLFALEAWAPQERVRELAEYAARNGLVFESRPPAPDEHPPTLMRNAPRVAAGEDLVNFYMTPGYWTWDPSGIVFVSFAIFFAMILADAGYAAVMGLGLLAFWRRLGRSMSGRRFRPLLDTDCPCLARLWRPGWQLLRHHAAAGIRSSAGCTGWT